MGFWMLLLSFLLSLVVPSHSQFQCSYSYNNVNYNLAGLKRSPAMGDYIGTDKDNPYYTYTMNVCAVCNTGGGCTAANGTICQFQGGVTGSPNAVIGTLNNPTPVWSLYSVGDPTKGVILTYQNGDICPTSGNPTTTAVSIVCNPDAPFDATFTVSVPDAQNPCSYAATMQSPNACPTSGNIPSIRPETNLNSNVVPSSGQGNVYYINVEPNFAELKITLVQTGPTTNGNLNLLARYGAIPTDSTFDRRDSSYSLNHELVIRTSDNPADNPLEAGPYYIMVKGYYAPSINFTIRVDLYECPGNCSGHGVCDPALDLCDCDPGYETDKVDCSAPFTDINFGQIVLNSITNANTVYYRLMVTDPNEFQLQIEMSRTGGNGLPILMLGYGYFPTESRNEGLVRDTMMPTSYWELIISSPKLDTGEWIIAVVGDEDQTFSYALMAHLFDCPGNCSGNGVCDAQIHQCTCNPDWFGAPDCSQYHQPLTPHNAYTTNVGAGDWAYFQLAVSQQEINYNADLLLTVTQPTGTPPIVYVQFKTLPSETEYMLISPTPRSSTQQIRIAELDLQTGNWFIGVQSDDLGSQLVTISYTFQGDCSFCVHGTCDSYNLQCTCNSGWQGYSCDVANTPDDNDEGNSVGLAVGLVFLFLFVGLVVGILIKREFPSVCGQKTEREALTSNYEDAEEGTSELAGSTKTKYSGTTE